MLGCGAGMPNKPHADPDGPAVLGSAGTRSLQTATIFWGDQITETRLHAQHPLHKPREGIPFLWGSKLFLITPRTQKADEGISKALVGQKFNVPPCVPASPRLHQHHGPAQPKNKSFHVPKRNTRVRNTQLPNRQQIWYLGDRITC